MRGPSFTPPEVPDAGRATRGAVKGWIISKRGERQGRKRSEEEGRGKEIRKRTDGRKRERRAEKRGNARLGAGALSKKGVRGIGAGLGHAQGGRKSTKSRTHSDTSTTPPSGAAPQPRRQRGGKRERANLRTKKNQHNKQKRTTRQGATAGGYLTKLPTAPQTPFWFPSLGKANRVSDAVLFPFRFFFFAFTLFPLSFGGQLCLRHCSPFPLLL